ncbi:thioredoxin domain-containing protein [Leptospira sp. GIMC2001]|uniref:thioredoxin domain-containing protein n=1 Tax=Leptospira sp. GIMC2001 TaxID=1513297 RepID=UPI00234AE547|nr:thioredoxin domain-containing protein [Leptospira sp. GIMC2001]WCL47962.1 thioredoxin domain-containing protein [Leptospira sp. GIMC2001]
MEYTNRLIHEKSPYLLQHSHNPVDWFPWGDEAFTKAKNEGKLIFLSIGYATCHWCHVMERESFENVETAKILNENFVSIKLDREERPDVDRIYMDAIHALNQQGGWPLNIFLTPDKLPLTGGTYFPPKARYGMKSFPEVLESVQEYWKQNKDEMLNAAQQLTEYLNSDQNSDSEKLELPERLAFENAYVLFEQYFDPDYYGFKTNNQNKFPPSMGLSYLMAFAQWINEPHALEMAELTLQAMKKGGVYDQIGGGLCRYSTDHEWLVPHFEKMLYDNALFLQALTEAWQITKKDFYKKAALDVIEYIERDLRTKEGGIASAEDADSAGEEGRFYIWDSKEIKAILEDDYHLFTKFWNISEQGNFDSKNILNETFHSKPNQDSDKNPVFDTKEFQEKIKIVKNKLLEVRNLRIRPLRDDKVLASWNALYIQSLAYSGAAFQNQEYINLACKTFNFIEEKLINWDLGIQRRYRDGESKYSGTLVDYAELGLAAMSLFRATQDIQYISKSKKISEWILNKFSSDIGPFYETEKNNSDLIRRSIDGFDSVEPSGNSATVRFFLALVSLGINTDILMFHSENIFRYFSKELSTQGISYAHMLKTYLESRELASEIVVVAQEKNSNYDEVIQFLKEEFLPGKIIVSSTSSTFSEDVKLIPILEGRKPTSNLDIYICQNRRCLLPVHSLDALKKSILQR